MNKIRMNINSRAGYSADQVRTTMTVQELINELEQFEPDQIIYTYDDSNRYGAPYGEVLSFEEDDGLDDEE